MEWVENDGVCKGRGEVGQVTGELHLSKMRTGCCRKMRENGR